MFSNKCSMLHSNSVFCYDKFSEPWYFEAIKDSEVIGKFKPMLITNKETLAKTTNKEKRRPAYLYSRKTKQAECTNTKTFYAHTMTHHLKDEHILKLSPLLKSITHPSKIYIFENKYFQGHTWNTT